MKKYRQKKFAVVVAGIVGARSVVLWRLSLSKPEQNNEGESRNPGKPGFCVHQNAKMAPKKN